MIPQNNIPDPFAKLDMRMEDLTLVNRAEWVLCGIAIVVVMAAYMVAGYLDGRMRLREQEMQDAAFEQGHTAGAEEASAAWSRYVAEAYQRAEAAEQKAQLHGCPAPQAGHAMTPHPSM